MAAKLTALYSAPSMESCDDMQVMPTLDGPDSRKRKVQLKTAKKIQGVEAVQLKLATQYWERL